MNKNNQKELNELKELLGVFKRWLTPEDLVLEFGLGLDMQNSLRKNNQIPYSKIGTKKIFYDREKINLWIESHSIEVKKSS